MTSSSVDEEFRLRLEQSARSVYDRMMTLMARDKYLRLHRERQTNIGKIKGVQVGAMMYDDFIYFQKRQKQFRAAVLICAQNLKGILEKKISNYHLSK